MRTEEPEIEEISEDEVEEVEPEEEEEEEIEVSDDEEEPTDATAVIANILSSTLATEEGETITESLVGIKKQMEVQNRLIVKLISTIQKLQ